MDNFELMLITAITTQERYIRLCRDLVDNTYFVLTYKRPNLELIESRHYKTYNGASRYFNSIVKEA